MFYSVGQVAQELGLTRHEVRRLCQAQLIRAQRAEAGHWQVPVSEVERLRQQGIPAVPHPVQEEESQDEPQQRGRTEKLPSWASEETYSAYDEAIRLKAEIETLELKKKKELASDFFRDRHRIEEERQQALKTAQELREEEERERRKRAREEEMATEKRRRRIKSWVDYAVRDARATPPEYRLAVQQAVTELLESLDLDLSRDVLQSLVDARIQKALVPWHRSERQKSAIERAVESLPAEARGWFTPTEWQDGAAKIAAVAIDGLCPDGTVAEMVAAARPAVEEIVKGFRHFQAIQSALNARWMSSEQQQEVARQLRQQPVGTTPQRLEEIRDEVLRGMREADKK